MNDIPAAATKMSNDAAKRGFRMFKVTCRTSWKVQEIMGQISGEAVLYPCCRVGHEEMQKVTAGRNDTENSKSRSFGNVAHYGFCQKTNIAHACISDFWLSVSTQLFEVRP